MNGPPAEGLSATGVVWSRRFRAAAAEAMSGRTAVGGALVFLAESVEFERIPLDVLLRIARELEGPPVHEWLCPSCGATTRARMADHPPEPPD